jgi:hypothetical protein
MNVAAVRQKFINDAVIAITAARVVNEPRGTGSRHENDFLYQESVRDAINLAKAVEKQSATTDYPYRAWMTE